MMPPDQPTNERTGSLKAGEPVFLVIGRLRRPHGVHGEISMEIITDFPERLKAGSQVFIGEAQKPFNILSLRPHGQAFLVSFQGYNTPEEVGVLRNEIVYVRTADRPPLPDGEYYHHQLIGLKVVGDDDQEIGKLVEILSTGANDVYVVKHENGSEILLPAIPDVVLTIDLDSGKMIVHLLEGLV